MKSIACHLNDTLRRLHIEAHGLRAACRTEALPCRLGALCSQQPGPVVPGFRDLSSPEKHPGNLMLLKVLRPKLNIPTVPVLAFGSAWRRSRLGPRPRQDPSVSSLAGFSSGFSLRSLEFRVWERTRDAKKKPGQARVGWKASGRFYCDWATGPRPTWQARRAAQHFGQMPPQSLADWEAR